MPQAIQNTLDEDAFMNNLLSGLDSAPQPEHPSKLNRTASCSSTAPKTPSRNAGSRPATRNGDKDISMLVDGAENWDWNDMEADFLTPNKSNSGKTPLKVCFSSVALHPLTRRRKRSVVGCLP
jgi:DNA replication ATP-dependent helicase Dna2